MGQTTVQITAENYCRCCIYWQICKNNIYYLPLFSVVVCKLYYSIHHVL